MIHSWHHVHNKTPKRATSRLIFGDSVRTSKWANVEVRYLSKTSLVPHSKWQRTVKGFVTSTTDRLTINTRGMKLIVPYRDIIDAKFVTTKTAKLSLFPGARVRLTPAPNLKEKSPQKIIGEIVSIVDDTLKIKRIKNANTKPGAFLKLEWHLGKRSLKGKQAKTEYNTFPVPLNSLEQLEVGSKNSTLKYIRINEMKAASM